MQSTALIRVVKGDGQLLKALDQRAAEEKLHLPQHATHQADKKRVDEWVAGEERDVDSSNFSDAVPRAFPNR